MRLFIFRAQSIFHKAWKIHIQSMKSKGLFQFSMPVIVHLNWIYYFHIVCQHLILAIVHVKSHPLFFVFKYLLIFSHFLHQAFHCLVFRLYINSILFKHAHSTLFLPYLLFFLGQIFGFRDLRCRLTFL